MGAPKKIYIQPSTIEQLPYQNIVYTKPLANNSIEYIRKDAFIEKVINFLNYKLVGVVATRVFGTMTPHYVVKQELIEELEKHMKGE